MNGVGSRNASPERISETFKAEDKQEYLLVKRNSAISEDMKVTMAKVAIFSLGLIASIAMAVLTCGAPLAIAACVLSVIMVGVYAGELYAKQTDRKADSICKTILGNELPPSELTPEVDK